jgi:hypothetical protein
MKYAKKASESGRVENARLIIGAESRVAGQQQPTINMKSEKEIISWWLHNR